MLLTLADYNISDRQYLSSVDKQFSVGRTLSLFENEVSVIAGRSKEKIDSISQFEKRLIKLKQVVADGPTTNHDADKEVDNMLRGPFSKDIRGEFKSCSKCGERFVKHLLLKHVVYCQGGANGQDTEKADDGKTTKTTASGNVAEVGPDEEVFCQLCGKKFTGKTISKHTSKCEERAKFLESKEGQESALISLLPPQKPRNIEVKLVGPDFIQLVWEPPILDGGCKVFDYELTYKHCVVETIGKQKIRLVEREGTRGVGSRWEGVETAHDKQAQTHKHAHTSTRTQAHTSPPPFPLQVCVLPPHPIHGSHISILPGTSRTCRRCFAAVGRCVHRLLRMASP